MKFTSEYIKQNKIEKKGEATMNYYFGSDTGLPRFPFRVEKRFNSKEKLVEFLGKELDRLEASEPSDVDEDLMILYGAYVAQSELRIGEQKAVPGWKGDFKMQTVHTIRANGIGQRLTALYQPYLDEQKRLDEERMAEMAGTFFCTTCDTKGQTNELKADECPKCGGFICKM